MCPTSITAVACACAHLCQNSECRAKVFFARMTPALLARTIEQQVPLPPLYGCPDVQEAANDGEHLREAAAGAQRAGRGGCEEAEEAVAVGKGDFGSGFFCAAGEDEEGAVGCPGGRCVLGVGEDDEEALAEIVSGIYTRQRFGRRGCCHHRVSLEVVCERFEVGRGRGGDARRTFEWETGRCASAAKRFDKTRSRGWISRLPVSCIQSCTLLLFFSKLPGPGSKGDVLVHERYNGGRRQGLLGKRRGGVVCLF